MVKWLRSRVAIVLPPSVPPMDRIIDSPEKKPD